MSRMNREGVKRVGSNSKSLCPEQIRHIRDSWNRKGLEEIALEVNASFELVRNFAMTHYLYFNYMRETQSRI